MLSIYTYYQCARVLVGGGIPGANARPVLAARSALAA